MNSLMDYKGRKILVSLHGEGLPGVTGTLKYANDTYLHLIVDRTEEMAFFPWTAILSVVVQGQSPAA